MPLQTNIFFQSNQKSVETQQKKYFPLQRKRNSDPSNTKYTSKQLGMTTDLCWMSHSNWRKKMKKRERTVVAAAAAAI
jgi:hypothetical protein